MMVARLLLEPLGIIDTLRENVIWQIESVPTYNHS